MGGMGEKDSVQAYSICLLMIAMLHADDGGS